MLEDKRALLQRWLASGQIDLQPLTFPQRELWEASPIPVADISNHISCLIHVRGAMSNAVQEAALQGVVDHQEAMRVSFLPGKERPLQMIRRSATANITFRELSGSQKHAEAIEELAKEISDEPFDLVRGPLYRAHILRRSSDDHIFVFAIHHAIADGWTLGVFVQDLCQSYAQALMGRQEGLPRLTLTYTDWGATERAFWQRDELERRGQFWKSYLSGKKPLWGSLESGDTGKLNRWVEFLPAQLADSARELARTASTTLFSVLLTAFQVALSWWTDESDVLVGTPVANRSKPAIRQTMGYCSGIVPIRNQVDKNRSFLASLKAVHENVMDCFANAIPFVELALLLDDLPAKGHNPIFEVRFALQNHPVPSVTAPGLSARLTMRSTGTARFHLGCELTEVDEGLEIVWLFKFFSVTEIKRLAGAFQDVLRGACDSPENRIADLIRI
jgi:NRPS condensation-like uncharacterized protein